VLVYYPSYLQYFFASGISYPVAEQTYHKLKVYVHPNKPSFRSSPDQSQDKILSTTIAMFTNSKMMTGVAAAAAVVMIGSDQKSFFAQAVHTDRSSSPDGNLAPGLALRPDGKVEECSICLEALTGSDIIETPCKHKFHKKCIGKWTRNSNQCPICRMDDVKRMHYFLERLKLLVHSDYHPVRQHVLSREQIISIQRRVRPTTEDIFMSASQETIQELAKRLRAMQQWRKDELLYEEGTPDPMNCVGEIISFLKKYSATFHDSFVMESNVDNGASFGQPATKKFLR
jgi:hypothetical protein